MGNFSIFVETYITMIGKIDFLHPFEGAIEILSTNNTVEDRQLNSALYKLMCINDNETLKQRLQYHYTHDITAQTTGKLKQDKTIKKTLAIVNQLQEYIEEKEIKGVLCSNDSINAIFQIIDSTNLRSARNIFAKHISNVGNYANAIDHLLVKGSGITFKTYDYLTDDASIQLSDHVPYIVDFDLDWLIN